MSFCMTRAKMVFYVFLQQWSHATSPRKGSLPKYGFTHRPLRPLSPAGSHRGWACSAQTNRCAVYAEQTTLVASATSSGCVHMHRDWQANTTKQYSVDTTCCYVCFEFWQISCINLVFRLRNSSQFQHAEHVLFNKCPAINLDKPSWKYRNKS